MGDFREEHLANLVRGGVDKIRIPEQADSIAHPPQSG
jgi:hypothetical protein